MNTKLWWIVGGVLGAILIAAFLVWSFGGKPTPTEEPAPGGTTFPISGEATTSPSGSDLIQVVSIQQGNVVEVKDFKSAPTTVKDPYNVGYYDIAGGANPGLTNAPYHIFYDENHQYFGVTLLAEPLGSYRLEAEQFLQNVLGISKANMCRLNYAVGVGPRVNDAYSGNLGFSFCPGRTALP